MAPARAAIEPADIRSVLCDTFILEVGRARGDYPFRLAGTRLCAAFARELKGTKFLDLWDIDDRSEVELLLSAVAEDGRAAVAGVTAHSAQRRTAPFELTLLPLIQDGPRCDRVLGVLVPMELPFWLGLDPINALSAHTARLIWPDDQRDRTAQIGLQPEIVVGGLPGPEQRRERFVVLEGGKSLR